MLTILERCLVVKYTRTLKLELNSATPRLRSEEVVRHSFLSTFINIISSLTRLEHITLDIGDYPLPSLQNAINALPTNLTFARIKSLDVICRAAFLLTHCPNTTTLRLKGCSASKIYDRLLVPCATITSLSIDDSALTKNLSSLATAYPNIEHLVHQTFDIERNIFKFLAVNRNRCDHGFD